MRACVFAIPGDHTQKTGGYIYERRLLEALQATGREVRHLRLPPAEAEPGPANLAETLRSLRAIPADTPLILDGLVFGALPTSALATIACPVVAMLHHPMGLEDGLPPALARHLLAQEAANLAHADHVIVTSAHTRGVYIGIGAGPDRLTVALPGHDGPRHIVRVEAGPRLLSVGLLAPRKGHDVLVRALALLQDLDWTAQIVGKTHDPNVPARLTELIAEHGLESRVALAGELSDADLALAYRRARIFALATRYEGYGMALAEALCHGLPIATCAAGAVPDTVGDAALLSPPGDHERFADNLRTLLTSDSERNRLSNNAHGLAEALPDWSDTARIAGQVLDSLAP